MHSSSRRRWRPLALTHTRCPRPAPAAPSSAGLQIGPAGRHPLLRLLRQLRHPIRSTASPPAPQCGPPGEVPAEDEHEKQGGRLQGGWRVGRGAALGATQRQPPVASVRQHMQVDKVPATRSQPTSSSSSAASVVSSEEPTEERGTALSRSDSRRCPPPLIAAQGDAKEEVWGVASVECVGESASEREAAATAAAAAGRTAGPAPTCEALMRCSALFNSSGHGRALDKRPLGLQRLSGRTEGTALAKGQQELAPDYPEIDAS